jgi:hypothetical protein
VKDLSHYYIEGAGGARAGKLRVTQPRTEDSGHGRDPNFSGYVTLQLFTPIELQGAHDELIAIASRRVVRQ